MSLKYLRYFIFISISMVWITSVASPFEHLTDKHKQLIEEFVDTTGKMGPFRDEVRKHYHELVFIPTEKMFAGTILENDPRARDVMNEAIDKVLNEAFEEPSLDFVHYQIFSEKYSEPELEELIKFYRTDVGKKALDSDSALFEQWEKQRYKWAISLRQRVKDEVRKDLNAYHDKQLAEAKE